MQLAPYALAVRFRVACTRECCRFGPCRAGLGCRQQGNFPLRVVQLFQHGQDVSRIFELIPQVFPEKRGEAPVRSRLNEVVRASGFTGEYVARIRDGKVNPS